MDRWILWLAQGFGTGKIRPAPGTWGSLAGWFWFILLLVPARPWLFFAAATMAIAVSVGCCGSAERQLGRVDPPSVVLDELVAVPWCFAGWILMLVSRDGRLPAPDYFFQPTQLWQVVLIFVAFRAFDVAKPWPVGASQKLPGGWGITIDDLLAAIYVNLLWWGAYRCGLLANY
jgi:phosphatidylglycerophosphatase A